MRIPNVWKYLAVLFCIALLVNGCGTSNQGDNSLESNNFGVPSTLVSLTFLPSKVLVVPASVAFVTVSGTDAAGQAVRASNNFDFPVTLNYTVPLSVRVPVAVKHLHLDFLDSSRQVVGLGDLDVNLSANVPVELNIPFTDGAPSAPVTISVPPPVPANIVGLHLAGLNSNNAEVMTALPVFPTQLALPTGGGQLGPLSIPVSVTLLKAQFVDNNGTPQASSAVAIALTPDLAQTLTIPYPALVDTAPVQVTFNLTQGANFYGQGPVPGTITQIRVSGTSGTQSVGGAGFPATVAYAAQIGPINVPTSVTTITVDFLTADNSLAGTNSYPFSGVAEVAQTVNVPFLVPSYIFSNFNAGGVSSGPPSATVFSVSRPWTLQQIHVYHYGQTGPSLLGLTDANGIHYGPYAVVGGVYPGTIANLNVAMPAGTYTITDDFPAGWSWDEESAGRGFAEVFGTLH